jgi:hypothetical protein
MTVQNGTPARCEAEVEKLTRSATEAGRRAYGRDRCSRAAGPNGLCAMHSRMTAEGRGPRRIAQEAATDV